MRLGVFGGTFDPPHVAHLILAAEAHFQLTLDRVLWVLTPDPPHKNRAVTVVEPRMEMLDAAIVDNPDFESSRVDVDRGGPYFAVDTLKLLRSQYPQAQLVYLMGGDSLRDLPSWHRPREFMAACDEVGVMRRPDDRVDIDSLEAKIPGLGAKVRFVNAPLMDISGTQLRHRISAAQPFRYYLPLSVYQIIQERDLYR
jgi:nicotinate-nucleotide adenylyltransferase